MPYALAWQQNSSRTNRCDLPLATLTTVSAFLYDQPTQLKWLRKATRAMILSVARPRI
jgi:hypothetical protein